MFCFGFWFEVALYSVTSVYLYVRVEWDTLCDSIEGVMGHCVTSEFLTPVRNYIFQVICLMFCIVEFVAQKVKCKGSYVTNWS